MDRWIVGEREAEHGGGNGLRLHLIRKLAFGLKYEDTFESRALNHGRVSRPGTILNGLLMILPSTREDDPSPLTVSHRTHLNWCRCDAWCQRPWSWGSWLRSSHCQSTRSVWLNYALRVNAVFMDRQCLKRLIFTFYSRTRSYNDKRRLLR